jgi:hypothetical protein
MTLKPRTSTANKPGERLQPLANPLPAMLERAAAARILAAQKRPPHAAVDAMLDADDGRLDDLTAGISGHDRLLAGQREYEYTRPLAR